ncbi:hypothetical protein AFK66_020455 [Cronobacter malonaticus LMG 23826]|nr:hypothetical protein AFK66_020455 [Cronobacter malonaticus LMG 23826]
MTFRALARHRSGINHKLAFGIAIAGIEGFAKARPALNQMTIATLRAAQCGFVRFVDLLSMLTFRISAAADKHPKTPLPEHQRRVTCRALLAFEHFNNVTVRLAFQRANVITLRIMRTSQERTMLPGTDKKFSPAFWAGLVFGH